MFSKKKLIILLLVIIGLIFIFTRLKSSAPFNRLKTSTTSKSKSFNKNLYSIDNPGSIWVMVNKKRQLNPEDYAPKDLVVPGVALRLPAESDEMHIRRAAGGALENMFEAAKKDGIELLMASGYRPYSLQRSIYERYVTNQGRAAADSQSARPGYSEHQTGLAVDVGAKNRVCELQDCFSNTPESKWLESYAYRYGFVIRYQKDATAISGYIYEPWHLRYVGTELSKEIHNKKSPTLETFFGLPAAPDYDATL